MHLPLTHSLCLPRMYLPCLPCMRARTCVAHSSQRLTAQNRSKVVGNEDLEVRSAAARKLLVRDVVFAASLYT